MKLAAIRSIGRSLHYGRDDIYCGRDDIYCGRYFMHSTIPEDLKIATDRYESGIAVCQETLNGRKVPIIDGRNVNLNVRNCPNPEHLSVGLYQALN